MKYSKLLTVTAVFLLLFLLINGEKDHSTVEDAKIGRRKVCKYKSRKFRGVCLSDISCTGVCAREGFQGGDCRGVRRRCYCYNPC